MGTETYDFTADFFFEPDNNRYGQNHNGHTQSDTPCRNAYGRRYLFRTILFSSSGIYTFGNKQFYTHKTRLG